jgi:hypothetical protein
MTLRALVVGLMAVAFIAALTPYNDFYVGNTFFTGTHFPVGAFFILLVLTLVVNVALRLVRRSWALRQPELMLVWCMMTVSSTVVASGLMRYWFSLVASPGYYAARSDLELEKHVLKALPADLVLSKDPRSIAVRRFFEGPPVGEEPRTFWRLWLRPIAAWSVFIIAFYLATFFGGGMLRKQWVESERLIFPLARVPLELTEESDSSRLAPALLSNGPFLLGVALTLVFAFIRVSPVLTGKESGWIPRVNMQAIISGTPVEGLSLSMAYFYPIAVGFAFLVPADVALSIWLFFLFSRVELLTGSWLGTPLLGTYGPFMAWQQAGAFIVFSLMLLWMTRRHLCTVFRKAVGLDRSADDSAEPISYRLAFWGLVAAVAVMVAWFAYYFSPAAAEGTTSLMGRVRQAGSGVVAAFLVLALVLVVALVHARLVAQGGVFFTQQTWYPPELLQGFAGGHLFSAPAAVVARMQNAILTSDAREILSGHAMNALRISSVLQERRRWFLPAMVAALLVSMVVCAASTLRVYYGKGGLNTPNRYGMVNLPVSTFRAAHLAIEDPSGSVKPQYGAFALGTAIMFVLTALRARFYWWPVHSLGFLMASTYPAHHLWLSFMLGWLTKSLILKYGGGGTLRKARGFFLGAIIGESFAIGVTTLLGLKGIKFGPLFLPP